MQHVSTCYIVAKLYCTTGFIKVNKDTDYWETITTDAFKPFNHVSQTFFHKLNSQIRPQGTKELKLVTTIKHIYSAITFKPAADPYRHTHVTFILNTCLYQRRLVMRTCHVAFLKNISREPIGYNTKIGTGGVEWGRVDIWIVLRTSFEMV